MKIVEIILFTLKTMAKVPLLVGLVGAVILILFLKVPNEYFNLT